MKDQYLHTASGKLRYWQAGDQGLSIILIPGLGGTLENWQYNFNELSKKFKVYAVEPIGFGRSQKPKTQYSISCLARSVFDFMHAKEIPQANLIGNSLGGAIALKVAEVTPKKVNKLVLVGSAGFSSKMPLAFKLASIPLLGELLIRPRKSFTEKALKSFVVDPRCISDQFVEQSYQLAKLPGQKRVILNILRTHINLFGMKKKIFDKEFKRIKKIQQQTLLIWGKQDPVIPYESAEIAMQSLPNANLVTFDKCGHLAQIEKSQEFNRVVSKFLVA